MTHSRQYMRIRFGAFDGALLGLALALALASVSRIRADAGDGGNNPQIVVLDPQPTSSTLMVASASAAGKAAIAAGGTPEQVGRAVARVVYRTTPGDVTHEELALQMLETLLVELTAAQMTPVQIARAVLAAYLELAALADIEGATGKAFDLAVRALLLAGLEPAEIGAVLAAIAESDYGLDATEYGARCAGFAAALQVLDGGGNAADAASAAAAAAHAFALSQGAAPADALLAGAAAAGRACTAAGESPQFAGAAAAQAILALGGDASLAIAAAGKAAGAAAQEAGYDVSDIGAEAAAATAVAGGTPAQAGSAAAAAVLAAGGAPEEAWTAAGLGAGGAVVADGGTPAEAAAAAAQAVVTGGGSVAQAASVAGAAAGAAVVAQGGTPAAAGAAAAAAVLANGGDSAGAVVAAGAAAGKAVVIAGGDPVTAGAAAGAAAIAAGGGVQQAADAGAAGALAAGGNALDAGLAAGSAALLAGAGVSVVGELAGHAAADAGGTAQVVGRAAGAAVTAAGGTAAAAGAAAFDAVSAAGGAPAEARKAGGAAAAANVLGAGGEVEEAVAAAVAAVTAESGPVNEIAAAAGRAAAEYYLAKGESAEGIGELVATVVTEHQGDVTTASAVAGEAAGLAVLRGNGTPDAAALAAGGAAKAAGGDSTAVARAVAAMIMSQGGNLEHAATLAADAVAQMGGTPAAAGAAAATIIRDGGGTVSDAALAAAAAAGAAAVALGKTPAQVGAEARTAAIAAGADTATAAMAAGAAAGAAAAAGRENQSQSVVAHDAAVAAKAAVLAAGGSASVAAAAAADAAARVIVERGGAPSLAGTTAANEAMSAGGDVATVAAAAGRAAALAAKATGDEARAATEAAAAAGKAARLAGGSASGIRDAAFSAAVDAGATQELARASAGAAVAQDAAQDVYDGGGAMAAARDAARDAAYAAVIAKGGTQTEAVRAGAAAAGLVVSSAGGSSADAGAAAAAAALALGGTQEDAVFAAADGATTEVVANTSFFVLSITSEHGNPKGAGTYPADTIVNWYVEETVLAPDNSGIRYRGSPSTGMVRMNSNKTIVIAWSREYRFRASAAWGGSVAMDSTAGLTGMSWGASSISAWAREGISVRLRPVNEGGSHFTEWSGDIPVGLRYVPEISLPADRPRDVVAHFDGAPPGGPGGGSTLTINSNYGNPRGAGSYPDGTWASWSVTSPWPGGEGQRFVADPASGSVWLHGGRTVVVNWRTQWALLVDATNGSVDVPDGWYYAGATATLTATPDPGWHFVGWVGDVPDGLETDMPLAVTMDQPRRLTAQFGTSYNRLSVDSAVVQPWTQCATNPNEGWRSDVSLYGPESGVPATFDAVHLTTNGSPAFDETFETGTVGQPPQDWTPQFPGNGAIHVTDSPVYEGARALAVAGAPTQGQGVYRGGTFSLFPSVLSVRVYVPAGQPQGQLAPAFWYGGRCVSLRTAANDTLDVYLGDDVADGTGAPVLSALTTNAWHEFTLELFSTQVLDGDTDGDGLADADEIDIYDTEPLDPDTDHDGLGDGWEVANGTDPLGNETPLIAEGERVSVTMDHDGVLTPFSLTLNASDLDGDTISWAVSSPAQHGTASVNGSGTEKAINYTPAAGYFGADSFVVRVDDGEGGSDTITVDVNVCRESLVVTTDEDTNVSVSLLPGDGSGDQLAYTVVVWPAHGNLSASGIPPHLTHVYEYSPNSDDNGVDRFTYRAADGEHTVYMGSVTIIVNPVNDPPAASVLTAQTTEDQHVTVTLQGSDPVEGSPVTYAIGAQPAHGSVTLSGTQATYTPNPDFRGQDSFLYAVSDGTASASANVTVTVTPVNDAPEAVALTLTFVPAPDRLSVQFNLRARDVDSSEFTFAIPSGAEPKRGTAVIAGSACTYTPSQGFTGTDVFSYIATDQDLPSAPATVTVLVGMAEPVYLLEFNEHWLGNSAAEAHFVNAGFSDSGDYSLPVGASGVSFAYNDRGGTALHFDAAAPHYIDANNSGVSVRGPVLTYGREFVMEVGLRTRPLGPVDLIVDEVNGLRTLHWYLDVDGKMHVDLGETAPGAFALSAVSSAPVLGADAWTRLELVVDLDAQTRGEVVGMYVNGQATDIAAAAEQAPSLELDLTGLPVTMLRRRAAIALDVDFIRVITDLKTHSATEFHPGEVHTEEDTGTPPEYSSVSIMAPATTALRRTRFTMVELNAMSSATIENDRNGVGVASLYDTHPNPPCVFHGVFEINFALEKQAFTAETFTVDVYAQYGETPSAWKKIAEVPLTRQALVDDTNPAGICWVHRFWDSHVPAFDWTAADTAACGPAATFNLKFKVR
ncbi:MAG: hypothetical protein A3K19_22550 [Lentisphaerae bacterium RIFOXYB12_FULL_65_16]|nr:MAG: hypothetical protein A3K18_17525 [Lentisphaerae bacterium RIFOXYA12_64_32]OGV92902.1 MAG: hypothetical protein A3K19_22550 [Lentisphaerae bacterium RIFOXYB12_FULL_65_16]